MSVHTTELFPQNMPVRNRTIISVCVISISIFVYIMVSADLLPLLGVHLPLLPFMAYMKIGSATLAAFTCFWYFRGLQKCPHWAHRDQRSPLASRVF
ncbi:MAG: hypothetical protein A4E35_00770 [Methanoregula sp. PtaU1.Bin051]|nr:MAG: hypothetical protein A4E35_00770 [Methanoregula sp. PtaU1.Bin051]